MKQYIHVLICFIIFLLLGKSAVSQQYEILFLKNNYNKIIDIAKDRINTNTCTSNDYYWYSLSLNKKGQVVANTELLLSAVLRYPNNDELKKLLSSVYYQLGNYKEAIPILQKLTNDYESQTNLAKIYEFYSEYESANVIYKNLLKQDTANINYLRNIAKNYYRIDSLNLAATYYNDALIINFKDQPSALFLSKIYIELDSCEKSVNTCERILAYDSLNVKFIKQAAYSYFKCAKFNEAKKMFSKSLALGDTSTFILKYLGIAEMNSQDFHNGREHLLLSYQKDSSDFEVCFFLGRAYLNSMEQEKGLFFLCKADSIIQPKNELLLAISKERTSLYNALGMFEKELISHKRCYELSKAPEFLFYIASLYQNKLDNKEQALNYYKLFIDELPNKETSEQIMKNQMTISLKNIAENNITKLTEDLFFERD
jgi:tetratricopeptide (TPR) repeat protein